MVVQVFIEIKKLIHAWNYLCSKITEYSWSVKTLTINSWKFYWLAFFNSRFYVTASTIDKREVHGDGCVEF